MITRMTVWHVARDTHHSTPSSRQKYRRQHTCNNSSQLEARIGRLSPNTLEVMLRRTLFFYGPPLFFWHMLARFPSCRGSPVTFPSEDLKWSPKIIRLVKPLVNMIKTSDHASRRFCFSIKISSSLIVFAFRTVKIINDCKEIGTAKNCT